MIICSNEISFNLSCKENLAIVAAPDKAFTTLDDKWRYNACNANKR